MLIIVEGPDGAGKSTLVDILQDTCLTDNGTVLHAGPPGNDIYDEWTRGLLDYDPRANRLVTCDRRHHVGELIYGPVLRGESRLTVGDQMFMNLWLQVRGALTVYLLPPYITVLKRFKARGDELVGQSQLFEIYDAYVKLYEAHRHDDNVVSLRHGEAFDAAHVLLMAEKLSGYAQARDGSHHPTLVGGKRGSTLLLGDRHPDPDEDPNVGAFNTVKQCSRYLFNALAAVVPRYRWQDVSVANAHQEDVNSLVAYLRPRRVVSLGKEASRACAAHGVRVDAEVPHPQYWRRFRHHDRGEYEEQLREAMGL